MISSLLVGRLCAQHGGLMIYVIALRSSGIWPHFLPFDFAFDFRVLAVAFAVGLVFQVAFSRGLGFCSSLLRGLGFRLRLRFLQHVTCYFQSNFRQVSAGQVAVLCLRKSKDSPERSIWATCCLGAVKAWGSHFFTFTSSRMALHLM